MPRRQTPSALLDVLGEDPDRGASHMAGAVEKLRGNSLNDIPMGQELGLPRDAQRAAHPGEFVHRSVADLTFDGGATVEHRKPECEALVVVSHDLATG